MNIQYLPAIKQLKRRWHRYVERNWSTYRRL